MIRVLAIVVLLACFLAGCSSAPSDNSANSQQPTPAVPASEFSDPNAALAEGSKLLDQGDTDLAIEMLNRAVELNPDLAEAHFKLGIAYALVEARDQTVVEEQVTPTPPPGEKTPRAAKTNSERAFEKAVEAYKKIIEANPEDDVAHYNLGRAYNKLNEDKDAEKALRQAVKLKPDDTEYQTELGAILVKLAQYGDALSPLKKAIDLDPENSRAMSLLEDAEAGKRRIDFVSDRSNSNRSANSNRGNSNVNGAEVPSSNSNTARPPAPPKTPPPAPRPTARSN